MRDIVNFRYSLKNYFEIKNSEFHLLFAEERFA